MNAVIQLTPLQLISAVGLAMMAIGISAWQKLGLEWSLAIATLRTIGQLLAVGYLLAIVFTLQDPGAILAIIGLMLSVAAFVARNRISKTFPLLFPLLWVSIFIGTLLTLVYTHLFVIQPKVWYDPQYLIPLAGIVLGNAMTSSAIAGERLLSAIQNNRVEIETYLSLGASPQEAVARFRREAVRAGLIPTINAMMVVGLVTLPGIITGQLLSGISPLDAAGYQMLIMFMIAFASIATTSIVTWGMGRQCFTPAMQLSRAVE